MLLAERRALAKVNSIVWDQWCFDVIRVSSSMNSTWKFQGPSSGSEAGKEQVPRVPGPLSLAMGNIRSFQSVFSIVHVAEKEIIEEGIPVLQIQPAGDRVSCQRLTDEDGVEKSDSQSGCCCLGLPPPL